MASCRIVNATLAANVATLSELSTTYETLGNDLITKLNSAIAEMEGDAKDAFKEFLDKDVTPFVSTDLPAAIKGMSDLLEANRSNFEEVDRQIANSIRGE
ncbi:MAG: hypothetical protein E7288_09315 [Lachnospiraceae bacterium]|nr:hypothetical protein [Lachnospiraceae bacterium]